MNVTPNQRRNLIRAFLEYDKLDRKLEKLDNKEAKLGPANNWTGVQRRVYKRIQEISGPLFRRKFELYRQIRYHKFENLIRNEAKWRRSGRLLRRYIPLVGETFRNMGRAHEQQRARANYAAFERNMASPSRGLAPVRMRGPSPVRTSPVAPARHSPRRPLPHRIPSGPAHIAITWTRGPNGKINVHKTFANINRALSNSNYKKMVKLANENENAFKNYVRAIARK